MKWFAVRDDRILCTLYAPDRHTAAKYLPPMFKGAEVVSSLSYDQRREDLAAIRRDRLPPKDWTKG